MPSVSWSNCVKSSQNKCKKHQLVRQEGGRGGWCNSTNLPKIFKEIFFFFPLNKHNITKNSSFVCSSQQTDPSMSAGYACGPHRVRRVRRLLSGPAERAGRPSGRGGGRGVGVRREKRRARRAGHFFFFFFLNSFYLFIHFLCCLLLEKL